MKFGNSILAIKTLMSIQYHSILTIYLIWILRMALVKLSIYKQSIHKPKHIIYGNNLLYRLQYIINGLRTNNFINQFRNNIEKKKTCFLQQCSVADIFVSNLYNHTMVYFINYRFSVDSLLNIFKKLNIFVRDDIWEPAGAAHADDLCYLFR